MAHHVSMLHIMRSLSSSIISTVAKPSQSQIAAIGKGETLHLLGGFLISPKLATAAALSLSERRLDLPMIGTAGQDMVRSQSMQSVLPFLAADKSTSSQTGEIYSGTAARIMLARSTGNDGTHHLCHVGPCHLNGASPLPSHPTPTPLLPPLAPSLECGKRGMTYQPSRRKRVNSHGLEKRLGTPGGRLTILRRIQEKKRAKLTVDCFV